MQELEHAWPHAGDIALRQRVDDRKQSAVVQDQTLNVGWPSPEPRGTTKGGRAPEPVLALAAAPVAELPAPPEAPLPTEP